MTTDMLTAFFMWNLIINGGVLIVISVFLMAGSGWVYRTQSQMFPISREAFNVVIYCFLAGYKMLWIVFNVVPYVALQMVR